MSDGDVILTRDASSGRIHKRVRLGAMFATLEGDNLDQSGDFEIIASIEGVARADLCENCFPLPAFEATINHPPGMGA